MFNTKASYFRQNSTANTAKYSTVQNCKVQYNIRLNIQQIKYSIVQYSTVQYSTWSWKWRRRCPPAGCDSAWRTGLSRRPWCRRHRGSTPSQRASWSPRAVCTRSSWTTIISGRICKMFKKNRRQTTSYILSFPRLPNS